MPDEKYKKKAVLGIRLSYLSEHEGVRRSIRSRMGREELLAIVRSLDVNGVQIDLVANEREDFAGRLETLIAGARTRYLAEPEIKDYDTLHWREHDWEWWEQKIKGSRRLRDDLHEAVQAVLDQGKRVDVYGEYKSPTPAVDDRTAADPELAFQTTEHYTRVPTEKG